MTNLHRLPCWQEGSANRATASTLMNNRSSRSHAIFSITMEQRGVMNVEASRPVSAATSGRDGDDEMGAPQLLDAPLRAPVCVVTSERLLVFAGRASFAPLGMTALHGQLQRPSPIPSPSPSQFRQ